VDEFEKEWLKGDEKSKNVRVRNSPPVDKLSQGKGKERASMAALTSRGKGG